MSKFLIHIHSGPDLKNKLTLGLLVAATAIQKGHNVEVFLQGVAAVALQRALETYDRAQGVWRGTGQN